MKLCDTCIYRNNVEQLKPCIIYRDDCEFYGREGDMNISVTEDINGQKYVRVEQEPNGDVISREAVIEGLNTINGTAELDKAFEVIERIPPVNQEPKTGHWVDNNNGTISCSYCHTWFNKDDRYSYMYYCPNCGARMVEPQERSE